MNIVISCLKIIYEFTQLYFSVMCPVLTYHFDCSVIGDVQVLILEVFSNTGKGKFFYSIRVVMCVMLD